MTVTSKWNIIINWSHSTFPNEDNISTVGTKWSYKSSKGECIACQCSIMIIRTDSVEEWSKATKYDLEYY